MIAGLLACTPAGGEAPASVTGAATACAPRAADDLLGWSVEVPCDWERTVAFENPAAGPEVILRRVVFRGPTRADLVVDVWDDAGRLGLDRWLALYGRYATYADSTDDGPVHAGRRGFPGVAQTAPGGQSPVKHVVILSTGTHVVRLMYVDTDAGASAAAFARMIATFDA